MGGVNEGWGCGWPPVCPEGHPGPKDQRAGSRVEKGDTLASPQPAHFHGPSCSSEKIHWHPTHTHNLTLIPTPQIRHIHSHTQTLNHTSMPQAHTHIASASTCAHTCTHPHNGTPALSHPYIPNAYIFSNIPQAYPPSPSPLATHIHLHLHTEHGHICLSHTTGTHGLPPKAQADPHIPHTPRCLQPKQSLTEHPPTAATSLPPNLPALTVHPTPPPQTRSTHFHTPLNSNVHTKLKKDPPRRYEDRGPLSDTLPPPPHCSQCSALSPRSRCPLTLCKSPNTGAAGVVGQQSAPPAHRGCLGRLPGR